MTGPEKAAVFLVLVGEEVASMLAGSLDEKELIKLRQGIHGVNVIQQEQIQEVFEAAAGYIGNSAIVPEEMTDYLKRVLTKAVGPDKAITIVERIFQEATDSSGVEALHDVDGETLANLLREEHPQTIAFVLAHLYSAHAGQVLSFLDREKQKDVAYRIATLHNTSPGVIEEVGDLLCRGLRRVQGRELGGVRQLAEILNCVSKSTEEHVLAELEGVNDELAENVRRLMFVFEDLGKIDEKSMQVLTREVEKEKWVMAMRTASPGLKQKVFGSMSERAGALLREEMESMGPVRLRDVESAQHEILEMARKLEGEGKVYLTTGKNKEDVLV
ncbi:MAG: flagellar motor switch protein FliG [Deltaproteobacteria bacterium]|nr:flagellar motor switch protein FliG [Deltaproteobacteria bacterium]